MIKTRKVFYKKINTTTTDGNVILTEPKCPYFNDVWFVDPTVGSSWCKKNCSKFRNNGTTKIFHRNYVRCYK